jgi:hypothetical protein
MSDNPEQSVPKQDTSVSFSDSSVPKQNSPVAPPKKKRRRQYATKAQWQTFFRALELTGEAETGYRESGIPPRTAEYWRAKRSYIAAEWQRALDRYVVTLERAATIRGRDGYNPRPLMSGKDVVLDPKTQQPVIIRDYSDRLLLAKLRKHKPQDYGPDAMVQIGQIGNRTTNNVLKLNVVQARIEEIVNEYKRQIESRIADLERAALADRPDQDRGVPAGDGVREQVHPAQADAATA